jgi:hypothetical protein
MTGTALFLHLFIFLGRPSCAFVRVFHLPHRELRGCVDPRGAGVLVRLPFPCPASLAVASPLFF